jgi:hypothetical protein
VDVSDTPRNNKNKVKMEYTEKQIENAKRNYIAMLKIETLADYNLDVLTKTEAIQRMEANNQIVEAILAGDKELEKKWKMFFLRQEVLADQKAAASKAKLNANKEASADVLSPIKAIKKIGEFGKWLNTSSNPFRKQHFNKKYTVEAVNAFLETI